MARGDHVVVTRPDGVRHGIDVGDGTVVHAERAPAAVRRVGWPEFTGGCPHHVVPHPDGAPPDHVCLRALARVAHPLDPLDGAGGGEGFARSAADADRPPRGPVRASVAHRVASEPGLRSLFHYTDRYTLGGEPRPGEPSPAGPLHTVTLDGRWFGPDQVEEPPPGGVRPAGHVLVDDALVEYVLHAGVLVRREGGVRQVGLLRSGSDGHVYLTGDDGHCTRFAGGAPSRAVPLPPGTRPMGYLFRSDDGTDHVMNRTGWVLHRDGRWAEETPPTCDLRLLHRATGSQAPRTGSSQEPGG